jgi:hypothetical protein
VRIALISAVLVCASVVAAPVPKAVKQVKLKVVIDADGGVTVCGQALKMDAKCDQLHDLIGKPDRTLPGANVRHTWDRLGITALYDNDSRQLKEFSVVWRPEYEFGPTDGFVGELVLNDLAVTPETTIRQINEAGPKAAFGPVSGSQVWFNRLHPTAAVYIGATTTDSDAKGGVKYIAIDPIKR